MDQEIRDTLGKKDASFPTQRKTDVISPPDKSLAVHSRPKETIEVRALKKMVEVYYVGILPKKLTKKEYLALKKIAGDKEVTLENESIQKALMLNGLETNLPIINALKSEYMGFALKLVQQIEKEYDCKSPSEKATAQIAATAYARVLQYEEKLRDCFGIEYHSGEKNGFFSLMSKEIDRANRQYFMAIGTLRQIKAPSIQINVKANAAFLAKNQQVNLNNETKNDYENNKAE